MAKNARRDSAPIRLDPRLKSARATEFEEKVLSRMVGQREAVRLISRLYQTFLAGMAPTGRPIGTALFLGPTGSGKTHLAGAVAEALFGHPKSFLKVDCGEYQHPHEIAKLVGSPPGYIGHRDTAPLLSQENLNRYHTPDANLSVVVFDEIEKACDALWNLLLAILDTATLSLGDNRTVDFSRSIVILTSNLGAREMSEILRGSMGFDSGSTREPDPDMYRRMHRAAVRAARRKFSPEFINRIDQIVVFRALGHDQLREVLDMELRAVEERIQQTHHVPIALECTDDAKDWILAEGTDDRYGARHLKRAIERLIVGPLSTLLATGQLDTAGVVTVDRDPGADDLVFEKTGAAASLPGEAERAHQPSAFAMRHPELAVQATNTADAADTAMQHLAATLQRAGLL
jgi:ATP-dependent Clp protease ATP-binding subunit ClpA